VKTCCLALASLLIVPRLPAQEQPGHGIRWWEAAAVVGVIGVASFADRGVNTWIQDHRTSRSDALARSFRTGGEPELVFGVPAAIIVTGVVGGRAGLRRSGVRVLSSVVVAGVTTAVIKEVAGRVRPSEMTDPYVFKPFTHNDAFPSGHATMAFALATSLGQEIHNRWVSAGLYAGATGTAWSRLNDRKHWLSDVMAGAAVGITAAKVMKGRWRVFGLGPPRFLIAPHGARLKWRAEF
jgi:membrane-associated phospholipid phosphatase